MQHSSNIIYIEDFFFFFNVLTFVGSKLPFFLFSILSNGEEWYKLRKVVQHIMLRPQKSLDYLRLQNKVAGSFVDKFDSLILENGEIPNFNRWMARWGLECKLL